MRDSISSRTPRKQLPRFVKIIAVLLGIVLLLGGAFALGSHFGWPFGKTEPTAITQTQPAPPPTTATLTTKPAPPTTTPSQPLDVTPPKATPSATAEVMNISAAKLLEEVERKQVVPEPTTPATPRPEPTPNDDPPKVILAGEDWFGGDGINVCTGSTHEYCGDQKAVGGPDYNRYQCVELAQRLYTMAGWYDGIFEGVGGAKDIYTNAEKLGMEATPYNQITKIASGDIIVHNSAGYDSVDQGQGHDAIVDFVDGNIVHAVEQNANKNGLATYIVVDNTLLRVDIRDGKMVSRANTVKGFVHSPKNTDNKPYELRAEFDEAEFAKYLEIVKEKATQTN